MNNNWIPVRSEVYPEGVYPEDNKDVLVTYLAYYDHAYKN